MTFEKELHQKIYRAIEEWMPANGYAISFFLEMNSIDGNMPRLNISYNTEADCKSAPSDSEERWNYAFWAQNTVPMIETPEEIAACVEWLNKNGVQNVGDETDEYDDSFIYRGCGPAGYKEIAELLSVIAISLRKDGVLKKVFGRDVPIIIHELEYYDYIVDLAKRTNPPELIEGFLKFAGGEFDLTTPGLFSEEDGFVGFDKGILEKAEAKIAEIGTIGEDVGKFESIIDILGLNSADKANVLGIFEKATKMSKRLEKQFSGEFDFEETLNEELDIAKAASTVAKIIMSTENGDEES